MLNPDSRYSLIEKLKYDLQLFADTVKNDLPHSEIFNINGFGRQNMQSIFDRFILIFNLNAWWMKYYKTLLQNDPTKWLRSEDIGQIGKSLKREGHIILTSYFKRLTLHS